MGGLDIARECIKLEGFPFEKPSYKTIARFSMLAYHSRNAVELSEDLGLCAYCYREGAYCVACYALVMTVLVFACRSALSDTKIQ